MNLYYLRPLRGDVIHMTELHKGDAFSVIHNMGERGERTESWVWIAKEDADQDGVLVGNEGYEDVRLPATEYPDVRVMN